MNKIYTKKGDKGQTSTVTGQRLPKSSPIFEAQGDLDELNCELGLIQARLDILPNIRHLEKKLFRIQNNLFTVGSLLSFGNTPPPKTYLSLEPSETESLEEDIDSWTEALPPLSHFILPGGSVLVSHIQKARAICRRAERHMVVLADLNPTIVIYINRLSDWLFMFARLIGDKTKTLEIKWQGRTE